MVSSLHMKIFIDSRQFSVSLLTKLRGGMVKVLQTRNCLSYNSSLIDFIKEMKYYLFHLVWVERVLGAVHLGAGDEV